METYSCAFLLCVLVCEDNKQNVHWAVMFERCFFFSSSSDQVAVIGTRPASRHATVRRGLSVKPAPPPPTSKVPGTWFRTNAHKHKRTWGTPSVCVCVCMYGFVCFPPVFCVRRRGKTAGSGPRRSRTRQPWASPRSTNASQKTDKPELLFIPHRHGLNGAPSCPSFTLTPDPPTVQPCWLFLSASLYARVPLV